MDTMTQIAAILAVMTIDCLDYSVQGPVRNEADEQGEESSLHRIQDEGTFGQRLMPLGDIKISKASRSSSLLGNRFIPTTLPPTTLSDILQGELLQQRSIFTGDPIVFNKSEGACAYEGRVFRSGENIERSHLCHFCFCRNGYIDCYWKNCPPPPEGCIELSYEGVCERSLYLCPIPKKSRVPFITNKRDVGTRNERQTGPGNFTMLGCDILGVRYRVGELVGVATDPCLECRCALDSLYCSPKCCFQPAEPDLDVPQLISRANENRAQQSNPLLHLRSDFDFGR